MVEAPKRSVCELAPEHLARIRRRLVGERGLGLDGKAPLSRPGSKSHESPTFIPVEDGRGEEGWYRGGNASIEPRPLRGTGIFLHRTRFGLG